MLCFCALIRYDLFRFRRSLSNINHINIFYATKWERPHKNKFINYDDDDDSMGCSILAKTANIKVFQNKFHSNTTNEPKQYQLRRMHVTGTSTTTCLFCCCSSSSSSTTAFYTILDWFQFYLHLFLLFLLLVTVTANTVWLNFKLARMEIEKSPYNSRTFVKYLECNFLIGYICTYVCI